MVYTLGNTEGCEMCADEDTLSIRGDMNKLQRLHSGGDRGPTVPADERRGRHHGEGKAGGSEWQRR